MEIAKKEQAPEESAKSDWDRWKLRITDEMKASLKALEEIKPLYNLKVILLIGIWLGLGTICVYVDSIWIRIPCWIVIGFALHGLGVFMHEGAHNALFARPVIDRVIGFLCGIPLFFSCSNYRATHMLHHRYENSARDPDNLEANVSSKLLRWLIFYGWFIIGMPTYVALLVVVGPFRAQGWKEKLACLFETIALAAIIWTVFFLGSKWNAWDILLNGWLFGLAFAILIANMRGLAEHTILCHTRPPNQLHSTRAIPTNAWVRFFFNNQNYHLEHHLFPRVPWNNLGRVHRHMKEIYKAENAALCRTYGEYLKAAFRHGPNRQVRYLDGKTVLDQDCDGRRGAG